VTIMKIQMNWGTGIAASYLVFAAATMGFVVFAERRPVDLVAADYYAQSLKEDAQMEAARNARQLGGAASVVQSGDRAVAITLPPSHAGSAHGTVTLYRAADAAADRVVDLKTDAGGRQQIPLDGLRPGVWLIRLRWHAEGHDFYLEQRVFAR